MTSVNIFGKLNESNSGCLDHVLVHVSNLQKSTEFYLKALAPLGYEKIVEMPEAKLVGLGTKGKPDFFLKGSAYKGRPVSNCHLAWKGKNEDVVKAFHKAAMEAGGKDNGAPGPRPQYHPGYYSAFVLDPDGINIEVVYHESGMDKKAFMTGIVLLGTLGAVVAFAWIVWLREPVEEAS